MLYRVGSDIEWEGRNLSTLTVASAEQEAAAVADGWQRLDDLIAKKAAKAAAK
jgi:hypothetical protein